MTSQGPGNKKYLTSWGPGQRGGPGWSGRTGRPSRKKIKIATGTTMASAACGKAMARRVDDWASETAAPDSRGLVRPSPVPSSGDEESDEEREGADSNESGDDASARRSPEYGTGGLNDNGTITDDQQSEEEEDRSLEEEVCRVGGQVARDRNRIGGCRGRISWIQGQQ